MPLGMNVGKPDSVNDFWIPFGKPFSELWTIHSPFQEMSQSNGDAIFVAVK
jgi:hypothetical protein